MEQEKWKKLWNISILHRYEVRGSSPSFAPRGTILGDSATPPVTMLVHAGYARVNLLVIVEQIDITNQDIV